MSTNFNKKAAESECYNKIMNQSMQSNNTQGKEVIVKNKLIQLYIL
jgi:hypothetical protein